MFSVEEIYQVLICFKISVETCLDFTASDMLTKSADMKIMKNQRFLVLKSTLIFHRQYHAQIFVLSNCQWSTAIKKPCFRDVWITKGKLEILDKGFRSLVYGDFFDPY